MKKLKTIAKWLGQWTAFISIALIGWCLLYWAYIFFERPVIKMYQLIESIL